MECISKPAATVAAVQEAAAAVVVQANLPKKVEPAFIDIFGMLQAIVAQQTATYAAVTEGAASTQLPGWVQAWVAAGQKELQQPDVVLDGEVVEMLGVALACMRCCW